MATLLPPPPFTSTIKPHVPIPRTIHLAPTQCQLAGPNSWLPPAAVARISFSSLSQPLFVSSVGSGREIHLASQWTLGRKHVVLLNFVACTAAVSASWLFFSAIPALLAFKRAVESLEKLLDVTAEELPDTMAAVRLSGMEISDLTMELSDLGQEITQGVRSSTRAVRLAEDRLHRLTTMAPTVSMQGQATPRNETEEPAVARAARNMREGIVKGRAVLGALFSMAKFSRWVLTFLKRSP